MAWSFVPATKLEIKRFHPSPFGEIVWHLSTQVNKILLAAYITVFDPRRDNHRCFIPCMVFALVYPSIASKLVTLATLNPQSDSVCTHTYFPFLGKSLLRRPRTVETRILINWYLALNIFGY